MVGRRSSFSRARDTLFSLHLLHRLGWVWNALVPPGEGRSPDQPSCSLFAHVRKGYPQTRTASIWIPNTWFLGPAALASLGPRAPPDLHPFFLHGAALSPILAESGLSLDGGSLLQMEILLLSLAAVWEPMCLCTYMSHHLIPSQPFPSALSSQGTYHPLPASPQPGAENLCISLGFLFSFTLHI